MARSFEITSDPTTPLLTTAEAKTHLKVDTTADDTYIDNLISAATQSAEKFTNRFFINTDLKQYGDTWSDIATLFKSPVNSVTHIKYYDSDDSLQTLASSVYLTDLVSKPAKITLKVNQDFPNLSGRAMAVEVKYVVGTGEDVDSVDDLIKQAVNLTVGHWYQNRQAVVTGTIATQLPMTAKYLLDQFKIQVCR